MASKPKEDDEEEIPSSPLLSSLSFSMEINPSSLLHRVQFVVLVLLCYLLWLRLLFFVFSPASPLPYSTAGLRPRPHQLARSPETCDSDIAPFYIHRIHPRFNAALVGRCLSRLPSRDCSYVGHRGLGRPLLRLPGTPGDDVEGTAWYATHDSAAEMLFHARAERHPCRTMDPEKATLFYVPFYAGLDAAAGSRQTNHTLRDALAVELAAYLYSLPSFHRHAGRDHLLAVGRPSGHFMRSPTRLDSGANRLLLLPEVSNMTILTVERHPWEGHNQVGIPYPSFFHPRTVAEVAEWQAELRHFERTHLFAFVGGPALNSDKTALRSRILNQCWRSDRCLPLQCKPGTRDCNDPDRVLDVMRRANFCMQPPDESFTRRSTFDSVLAGCIPVFFSEHSAYTQYEWYLPDQTETWSVLLKPEQWDRVEEELGRIPRAAVERMREEVIRLIPRLTYAHPDATRSELGFRDAIDVALVELTKRIGSTLQ
ncbi:putative xyloglucan galactosyltransferase GT17 [Canna indica]|uniref:Xyloglucan galactosyltransferase GT17 n=1 Tax=Canna indica TaxID=4628 RepID=A0AAQ3JYH3_9LILI|nr:putative xyloglucan galactosyltransferase GT17 [Canna indica]